MNRDEVESIAVALQSVKELPAEIRQQAEQLKAKLSDMSDTEFSHSTDSVVLKPDPDVGESPDIRFAVYDLYKRLNEYHTGHRNSVDSEVVSLLSRLQGLTDGYDRDFP